jgi:hypothetical protein
MSKRFLFIALVTFIVGLGGAVRADEAAKAPAPSGGECPHMKAMREAQEQGKEVSGCPHMKDGKPCDCPNHQAAKDGKDGKEGGGCPHMKDGKEGGGCPHMKDGKEGGACPHMKDGKPCDCPNHQAASAPKGDKPGKQPKADKAASKKGAKASSAAETKGSKE